MNTQGTAALPAGSAQGRGLARNEQIPVVAPIATAPQDFNLRDIVDVFRAHWLVFILSLLLVLGAGAALSVLIPPSYESTAVINLEDSTSYFDKEKMLGGEIPGLTRDTSVLYSLPLAIRVLQRLHAERLLKDEPGDRIASLPAKQIRKFRKKLRVEQTPGSSVIAITYKDTNPELAAAVVNRVVEEFRDMKSELLSKRYLMVKQSLDQEVTRLREEVRKAEEKVADYKKTHNLSDSIGISLKIRQVGDLNSELRQAQAELRDRELYWKQISSLLRSGDISAASTVVDSPLVRSLREQEVALTAKIRELEREYGVRHPIMAETKARLKQVQESFRKELNALANNAKQNVAIQRQKVSALNSSIRSLEEEILRGQQALVALKDMERDAESSRRVLEKFLVAEKQHSLSAQNQITLSNPITVISKGFVPVESVFPSPKHILLLSFLAASLLATMAVFFAEHLNPKAQRSISKRYRHNHLTQRRQNEAGADSALLQDAAAETSENAVKEEVRYIAEPPPSPRQDTAVIVPIPGDGNSIVPATEMLGKMQSRFSQAIARLHDTLMARIDTKESPIILVTSAGKKGDKVSIASALAALDASRGKKSLLVDLTFGEAELHRAFALQPVPGIGDVLHKKLSLLKAIQTDFRTHVSLFARGGELDQQTARKMIEGAPALFKLLRRYFDVVYVVVRDAGGLSGQELFADEIDQLLVVAEQKGNEHVRLTEMLVRSRLAEVKEKTLPVFVERQQVK